MQNLSVAEAEALGRMVGNAVRESFPIFMNDPNLTKSMRENIIDKMVEEKVNELIKKSNAMSRALPWGSVLAPDELFGIEKRLMEPAGNDEVTKALQDFNDDLYIIKTFFPTTPVQSLQSYGLFERRWGSLRKALNTQAAGQGLEWVPEYFSNTLIEFIELESVVAALFDEFTMPRSPFTSPVLLNDGEAYLGSEATSDDPAMYTASNPRTSNLTFTARKLIANYPVTDEMEEDSIIAVMPMLKKSIGRAIAKARDNAIVNGNTGLDSTLDSGYSMSSEDPRKAWDGLRKMCMSDLKQTGASWAASTGLGIIRAIIEDMGIYGLNPKDLAILSNTNFYNKLKSVTEVTTKDKIGDTATIVSGELKKFDGVDIVKSQHIFENVNASGVYDGITVSKTQSIIVYKPGFKRGNLRRVTMETERVARKGITYLLATTRETFRSVYDHETQPMIGWVYNVSK